MKESRRLIRQDRLQKFVRLLSGRYNINVILPEEKRIDIFESKLGKPIYYGYSDTKKNIWINPKLDNDTYENLIQQKSVALHELGHVLFTDGDKWIDSGVNHTFCNIIEDGRVEESMARTYPKARSYFFYLNEKIGKENKLLLPLPILTAEFFLRTAKKTTGYPPMPESSVRKLKKKLKDDYYWFGDRVRKAVDATTEEEAIKYTKEIEEKWMKLFGKSKNKLFPSMTRTPFKSIESKRKSQQPQPMPPSLPNSKSKQILEQEQKDFSKGNKKEKQQNKEGEGKEGEQKKQESDGESKEQKKNTNKKGKCKTAKQIYEDAKSEAKAELEKDAKKEIQAESQEDQSQKSDPRFDSYPCLSEAKKLLEGESISTIHLETIAQKLVHIFKVIAQRGKGWEPNHTIGKIDGSKLYKVANEKGDNRVFRQMNQTKEHVDLSVAILLDVSYSMQEISLLATESTYVVSRALELAKLNSEVIIFGTAEGYTKGLYGLKSFNQSLLYAKNRFIPRAIGNTPLFPALEGAQKSLGNISSKKKIIIVITDGEPNVGGGPAECKQKIKEIERTGISVVGILINTKDNFEIFFKENRLSCCNVNELPIKMRDVIKNVLMSIKK
jgi:hypothetical protein